MYCKCVDCNNVKKGLSENSKSESSGCETVRENVTSYFTHKTNSLRLRSHGTGQIFVQFHLFTRDWTKFDTESVHTEPNEL